MIVGEGLCALPYFICAREGMEPLPYGGIIVYIPINYNLSINILHKYYILQNHLQIAPK